MRACFRSADILLPKDGTAMDKWAVIACDQYTSQPEYWKQVEDVVGDAPSTLHMIYPEVYLEKENMDDRIHNIQTHMEQYMQDGTLQTKVKDGFILTERTTSEGVRPGLVGCVDLEAYDFDPAKETLVRATEGTIASRIPPRVRIRQGATVESPHIMLLIDDAGKTLIEPIYAMKDELALAYDTELMMGGGRIKGYEITGERAKALNNQLYEMQCASDGFFLAVGDGNHSLATAKTCWEQLKKQLPENECKDHPARYALVELVNLHDDSLQFEPIHRVLFDVDFMELVEEFQTAVRHQGMECQSGEEIVFLSKEGKLGLELVKAGGRLPVDVLQQFLDDYMSKHQDSSIDYVHGTEALTELALAEGNCGILLGAIEKSGLFPAIRAGGVLPRKTFSMGEAYEKRYYMECRLVQ